MCLNVISSHTHFRLTIFYVDDNYPPIPWYLCVCMLIRLAKDFHVIFIFASMIVVAFHFPLIFINKLTAKRKYGMWITFCMIKIYLVISVSFFLLIWIYFFFHILDFQWTIVSISLSMFVMIECHEFLDFVSFLFPFSSYGKRYLRVCCSCMTENNNFYSI